MRYPLIAVCSSVLTFAGALLMAKTVWGIVFLALVFILYAFTGYFKNCIKMLPFIACYALAFYFIFYFTGGKNIMFALGMSIRVTGVAVALIPGLSMQSIDLVRNLNSLKCPRLVTLGMLITLSFIPVLSKEMKTIKNAMKTRGVTNPFNPFIFYRAFLIPLIIRLINISDTLALSVETRGFINEKTPSAYKTISLKAMDIVFCIFYAAVFVLCLLCNILEIHL